MGAACPPRAAAIATARFVGGGGDLRIVQADKHVEKPLFVVAHPHLKHDYI